MHTPQPDFSSATEIFLYCTCQTPHLTPEHNNAEEVRLHVHAFQGQVPLEEGLPLQAPQRCQEDPEGLQEDEEQEVNKVSQKSK